MHELGIAQSIIKTVEHETETRGLPPVAEIGLRIGALSGVLPDALAFGFEALVADTPLASCQLVIEHVPAQARCKVCSHQFEVDDFFFSCPACEAVQVSVIHGYELDISYLKVEAQEEDAPSEP